MLSRLHSADIAWRAHHSFYIKTALAKELIRATGKKHHEIDLFRVNEIHPFAKLVTDLCHSIESPYLQIHPIHSNELNILKTFHAIMDEEGFPLVKWEIVRYMQYFRENIGQLKEACLAFSDSGKLYYFLQEEIGKHARAICVCSISGRLRLYE